MDCLSMGFKEILMKLLEDNDVKRKLIDVVGAENVDITDNHDFDRQISELKQALKEKEEEINRLQEKLEDKEKENQELQKHNDECVQELKRLQADIENTKKKNKLLEEKIYPVQKLAELWQRLMELDGEILAFLDKLSGSRDIRAYIVLGKEHSQIKQLWQFIRDKAVKGFVDQSMLEILSDYFDMCIEIYNITNNQREKLERISISEGTAFHSDYCIKTSKSILNGEISRILLNGYQTSGGKVLFPVIVKVD